MKKLTLFILVLFSISFSYAQEKEKLSEKEKARRQHNIDVGNPFARFGYKPKIATLSKGKYLEFHDRDSIVKIGSFTYHTRKRVITGFIDLDTVRSEATLRPEIVSRWFNPDPLSDEYPSWSPYNFTMNNPIRFIDPDGRAVEDIIIKGANGSSVTLTTDLIDITVNASSLGLDFGGNYNLEGEDVLSAGLDVVGVVDPTGVADGLNATLQAKNGDWLSAGISVLGIVPYVGDLAKVGKIGKDVKIINKAIDVVKASRKFLKFGADKAVEHFAKHGSSIMKALGKKAYNLKDYIKDANHIINKGTYVPELNGYVKLIGGKGSAKYGFVGLKKGSKEITTFHIKTAKELSKKAPSLGISF